MKVTRQPQVVKGGEGNQGKNRKPGVDDYFEMLEKAGAQRGRPEDLVPSESGSGAFTGPVRRLGVRAFIPACQPQEQPDLWPNIAVACRRSGIFLIILLHTEKP